eukprot:gene12354-14488_t
MAERRAAIFGTEKDHEEEIQKHFDDFFEDIHEGLTKYGTVELLHVCANLGEHLIGNVYVRYSTEDSAAASVEGLKGRFYDGSGGGSGGPYPDQRSESGYKRSRSRSTERERAYPPYERDASGSVAIGDNISSPSSSSNPDPTYRKAEGDSEKKPKTDSSSPGHTSFPPPPVESQTIQWASSEERRTDDYTVNTSLTKTDRSLPSPTSPSRTN